MSQFRIKNIDHALPDEWVYKINEGVSIVGDDIDARDPNELADAILDTQTIILKTSTLPAGAILKPTSGLAERITILEAIAGNSTLQDIYANGNTISILSGKPLTFGIREEVKLDDAGNLSFKPVTMKVRGLGFSTLDLSNISVTTNLGDLLVGATSPGSKLTLRAEDFFYLKDVFLNNPITLSEPGNTSLGTTSQSLVGAINELKASSFSTTFQSVYSQSQPPRLTTNIGQGAVIIEDPNPLSAADALRIIGILNVTKKAKVGDIKIGLNTTIADTVGYSTSDPIKTTNRVETPYVSSGINDLILQDKRISFPLSDISVADLLTTRKSIIGAINELKTDIITVGGSTTLFNNQHDSVTGFHKIITTQAEIGNNAAKRISVRNQSGVETSSISGFGELIASAATVGGLSVVTLLNDLVAHIANDGTAHSAFASHILDPNPHNTVKNIIGLTGNISLGSSNGTIDITTSGNTIDLKFNNNVTLQQTYTNMSVKELILAAAGLAFKDNSNALIMTLGNSGVNLSKNLFFDSATPLIDAVASLTIEPNNTLNLKSTTQDVRVETVDSTKKVIIQNVDFNQIGVTQIPAVLGTSVLGAFKKIGDGQEISLVNESNETINTTFPHFADPSGRAWPHIANLHPANEHYPVTIMDFFWANKSSLYFAKEAFIDNTSGTFYTSGTHAIVASSLPSLPLSFYKGAKLYPAVLGYYDITLTDAALIGNDYTITIDNDATLKGKTIASPVFVDGEYRIEQSGVSKVRTDKTRDNIIATVNTPGFPASFSLKAGIWGDAAKASIKVSGAITDGQNFQINTVGTSETVTVNLVARNTPTGFLEFQASTVPEVVAINLANAINKTTFKESALGITGHKCKATVIGSLVIVEFYKPGLLGELVTFSNGAANLTATAMIGGTSVVRIYDMSLANSTPYTVVGTGSGAGITLPSGTFVAREEPTEYFITASKALASTRNSPHYVATELGTIENVSGNTILFKIKG
jgi:hypothetical protein